MEKVIEIHEKCKDCDLHGGYSCVHSLNQDVGINIPGPDCPGPGKYRMILTDVGSFIPKGVICSSDSCVGCSAVNDCMRISRRDIARDKDKVIEALWGLLKQFHYDKCDAISRKCGGCALDPLCRTYTLSETLEQFTEKLLGGKDDKWRFISNKKVLGQVVRDNSEDATEGKDDKPEPVQHYCHTCDVKIECNFIFCKDCDKPLADKDDAHYERIRKLRETKE